MASPTQTTPATPPPKDEFDLLVFWMQHQRKVIAIASLLAVALLVFLAAEFLRIQKLTGSARALSTATDETALRKVLSDYPGTAAAGEAHLLLAERLRKAGKLDEAATTLRAFIDKSPEHPLISGAWTSLAATQEMQGKTDEALSTYQRVSTSFSTSFSAPVALLGQARIFKQKGKTEDARRIYDQVINQFPETLFSGLASRENQLLKK